MQKKVLEIDLCCQENYFLLIEKGSVQFVINGIQFLYIYTNVHISKLIDIEKSNFVFRKVHIKY